MLKRKKQHKQHQQNTPAPTPLHAENFRHSAVPRLCLDGVFSASQESEQDRASGVVSWARTSSGALHGVRGSTD